MSARVCSYYEFVTPDGQVHKAPLDGETLADDLDYWQVILLTSCLSCDDL